MRKKRYSSRRPRASTPPSAHAKLQQPHVRKHFVTALLPHLPRFSPNCGHSHLRLTPNRPGRMFPAERTVEIAKSVCGGERCEREPFLSLSR